ncbi:MAG TPA: hypothetical protein VG889_11165 [Rhizomicrobium sp.]|nr:hypothetical protein [Rhizomicrobium sp.]
MSPPPKLSRRSVTIGGIAAAGVAVVAGAAYELPKLFKHRAHGEYADLVNRLDDPDQAALLGKQVADAADGALREAASDIRTRLAHTSLPDLLAEDAASGRVNEIDGWVLPESLAQLCAMAALAQ